ncbi:ABC transporter permease subunit [uncultured Desulfobacter sp.]|uniref:ABC transporter permease n=1 Tax=uncultured Desulfobacter sp. TaxID=240139 RepID=UPI0029C7DA20|nr:ABC transporter permease subunit [uncultured Desulfobacter sp.]
MTWLSIQKPLAPKKRAVLILLSFVLPLLVWSAVSYLPFVWHPMMEIQSAGDSLYFEEGQRVRRTLFAAENSRINQSGGKKATGRRVNPVYLPPPHKVLTAVYTSFKAEPRRPGDPWLHESLAHSIRVVFYGFLLSSIIGVPLGIICGVFDFFSKLTEPFMEFFRYMPAPVFGALAVAVLGINDAPKIAIIFIGTFFQQVLVIGNTTRLLPPALLEAAQTLGARGGTLFRKVVLPAIAPHVFLDMRILLGWAWTYLIVAEVVGTSTGITWFINQQAKYRIYENVYAAILIIGFIGLSTDMLLAWIGRNVFVWNGGRRNTFFQMLVETLTGPRDTTFTFLNKRDTRYERIDIT